MKWIKLSDRKPQPNHEYYWSGKSNYGGRAYYDVEDGFCFDNSVPVNKVSEDYLCWLDEMAPDVELTVNELKGVFDGLKTYVVLDKRVHMADQLHTKIMNRIKELENNCPQDPKQGDMCGLK